MFLGHGWTVGLALEAALKFREAGGAWAEAYPAMEYRHGPISVAGPGTLVWWLGTAERDLVADVRATGASVVQSTIDPMSELVMLQRAAVALAEARGLDPDRPQQGPRSHTIRADDGPGDLRPYSGCPDRQFALTVHPSGIGAKKRQLNVRERHFHTRAQYLVATP